MGGFNPTDDLVVAGAGGRPGFAVTGLKAFSRELGPLGGEWKKELRKVNLEFSKDVAGGAEDEARSLGGVFAFVERDSGGFKARAQQAKSVVTMKHPAAAGAAVGAKKYSQFRPYIGGKAGRGYMVFAAVGSDGEEWAATYFDSLLVLAKKAFPD